MTEYNAGEGRVRIVPDARNFKKELEAQLGRIQAHYGVQIDADFSGFRADLEEGLRRISANLGVDVKPDLTAARAELDAFRTEQQRHPINIPVHVDLGRATADMAAWRAAQRADDVTVKVRADTSELDQILNRVTRSAGPSGGTGGFGGGGGLLGSALWNLGALGATTLPALGTGVAQLTASLQQLSQVGLALPGIYAGVGASAATLMMAFSGLKDALGDDPKKVAKAMEGLGPNTREAVTALQEFKTEFKTVKQTVQENVFAGLSKTIHDVAAADLPVLTRGFSQLATSWNGTLKQLGVTASSQQTQGILDRILGNTSTAQTKFTAAIDPLIHGIGTLTAAGTDVLPRLATALGGAAQRFDTFISSADKDGRLDTWINDGITGIGHLGETFLNLGKSITAITKAVGGGDGLLGAMEKGSKSLADFLNSTEGQAKLKKFFAEGREQLDKWLPILKSLPGLLGGLYDGAKKWGEVLLPPLKMISSLLAEHPGLIQGVVVAFLGWKSISGISTLAGGLAGIVRQLTEVQQRASAVGSLGAMAPGTAGAPVGGATQLTRGARLLRGGIGATMMLGGNAIGSGPDAGGLEQGIGAASMIGGGALAGSAFGPIGTAVGAGLGGVLALVTWAQHENAKAAKEAADAQAEYAARLDQVNDALTNMQGAQESINKALTKSGGKVDDNVRAGVEAQVDQLPGYIEGKYGKGAGDKASEVFKKAGLDSGAVATALTGDQQGFNSLAEALRSQGVDGQIVVAMLGELRKGFTDAQTGAEQAAPGLKKLADVMDTDIGDAANRLKIALQGIPKDVPIDITSASGKEIADLVQKLGVDIRMVDDKHFTFDLDSPKLKEVETTLDSMGVTLKTGLDGTVHIEIDQAKYDAAMRARAALGEPITINVGANATGVAKPDQPLPSGDVDSKHPMINGGMQLKALGGPIEGGTPGKDSVPILGMPGEHVLTTADVDAMGGQSGVYRFRNALHRNGGGEVIDQYGNPVTPGPAPGDPAPMAPNPAGGGLMSALSGFAGGLSGPIGNALNLGTSLAGQASGGTGMPGMPGLSSEGGESSPLSMADRAARVPGLIGLIGSMGSSDPAGNLMSWGEQTGQWLGNFTAKTVGGFATALWQGGLDAVGLGNSVLSPNNSWNRAGMSVGQFAFSSQGPLGQLLGANDGAGSQTSAQRQTNPAKLREAQQKITRADQKVAEIQQRIAELKPDAKQSQRMSLQDQLANAQQDAADARTDLGNLASGSTGATGGKGTAPAGMSGAQAAAYQAMISAGYGADQWPALKQIIDHESGFNPAARNPSSGAFGMFQFLGHEGDKYGQLGGYSSDPGSQSTAGLAYIRDRYGSPSAAWQFWQNHNWYAAGGGVHGAGTATSDSIPAWLSNGEHVLTAADVDAMGGQSGVYRFRNALHRAAGGPITIPSGVVMPPPQPAPAGPDYHNVPAPKPVQPAAPAPSTPPSVAAAMAPPGPPPTPPASIAPAAPPPTSATTPAQRPDQTAPVAAAPGSQGGGSIGSHNLDWIDTAIDSGASAVGQAIATGIGIAAGAAGSSGFAPGAGSLGSLGSYAAGLASQGGEILKNVVNVGSSFLVGSVPGSFGAQGNPYGTPLRPVQNDPVTAPLMGNRTYNIQAGYRPADMIDAINLKDAQDSQAALASWRG